jgi:hypothetical protein
MTESSAVCAPRMTRSLLGLPPEREATRERRENHRSQTEAEVLAWHREPQLQAACYPPVGTPASGHLYPLEGNSTRPARHEPGAADESCG